MPDAALGWLLVQLVPFGCLATIFNDYDTFTPQNLMVAQTYVRTLLASVKKVPHQASSDE
jgi:hypothetical protein